MKLPKDRVYKLNEERYCELARMIDSFVNVNKDALDGKVVYSAQKIKSTDFHVESITSGSIALNHNNNSVVFSGDLGLSNNLEDKLAKLILGGDE